MTGHDDHSVRPFRTLTLFMLAATDIQPTFVQKSRNNLARIGLYQRHRAPYYMRNILRNFYHFNH